MNQYAPDWSSSMGDAFAPLGGGDDDGLIELLWCNGHVVMQSQALRKPPPTRPDKAAAVPDDEAAAAAAWFQYPVEDPLERDLFSELFGETAVADAAGRARKVEEEEERPGGAAHQSTLMPPPPPKPPQEPGEKPRVLDLAESLSAECAAAAAAVTESMLTIGSSFCGSNHVQPTPRPGSRAAPCSPPPPPPRGGKARDAATVTSSSMRPRSCTTRSGQPGKRKQSEAGETEDVEFESADVTCEPAQKLTTAKRRRAAEVHNLSERRRRDRINEKMKALQELIPHCNKTDKASMLDEAIEYLKSLQLQLQMMWVGGGMAAAAAAAAAPVVFQQAGVHHHQYMPQMMAPPHHVHVASMASRMPFVAPPAAVQTPPVPDPYVSRFLAVDHLQPPPMHYLQGMGMGFYPQQIPALPPPPPAALPAATARTSPSDGILHKKYESCGKSDIQGMTS